MSFSMRRHHALVRASAAAVATVAILGLTPTTQAAGKSFGWKVNGRQTAIYLVGSVHMLSQDYYPLSAALEAAYKSSDLLVEEADLGEMLAPDAQMQFLTRSMLPADQSLDQLVSPATLALVNKHVESTGLPFEPLKRFKPWAIALTLMAMEWQKAGFDAELGLDKHFYDLAQTDGKTVQGLETVEYQISRFDGMTRDQQDRLLADTLKGFDTEMANVSKLADAWKAGDAPAVERVVLQDLRQDPQMYERLLVERNRNWLPKLEALLTGQRPALVVVGAAHLVGPDGLLALLKAKGFMVQQL